MSDHEKEIQQIGDIWKHHKTYADGKLEGWSKALEAAAKYIEEWANSFQKYATPRSCAEIQIVELRSYAYAIRNLEPGADEEALVNKLTDMFSEWEIRYFQAKVAAELATYVGRDLTGCQFLWERERLGNMRLLHKKLKEAVS